MSKNKKKLGYTQYENLLAEAHQKIEILAEKMHELRTYFVGYIEFTGKNIEFHGWMNKRLEEIQNELQKDEQPNERDMEPSTADEG